ncbi:MAG: hypothetical protein KDA61_14290 [Planctomycetales bacterium]|nr:hypothetical protein [Planctomycetales bacterium]
MRVRVRDGKLEATESSISETSVQPRFLAIVEVVDIGDAVALVERLPKVDLSAVEIRPLLPLPEPLSLPVGDANEAGASKAIAHEDFLVLLHAAAGAWPPEEHAVALAESVELCHRLYERGQFVSAAPLKPPETAVTVARRGARATVTDGPFVETTEQLGGYFLIRAATLDDACDVAGQIPGARRGTAEVCRVRRLA